MIVVINGYVKRTYSTFDENKHQNLRKEEPTGRVDRDEGMCRGRRRVEGVQTVRS